jgi:hypothetical protein
MILVAKHLAHKIEVVTSGYIVLVLELACAPPSPLQNIAMWPFSEPTWKTIAASKQRLREHEIQKVSSVLPALWEDPSHNEQYTSASSTQIVQNISEGSALNFTIT